MTPNLLSVPNFPRLADLVGVWAIEQQAGMKLAELVRNTDWSTHRHAAVARDNIRRVSTGGDKSIAVIDIAGPLQKHDSSYGESGTVTTRREIRNALNAPDISAIVLRIDSPGGTVSGTMDLANEVANARNIKPVYAFVEDLCASAAYWVASQCEKIFANNETALVGSIGTLIVVHDYSVMAEKEGIKTLVIATGDLKGAGAPGSVITKEQQAYFQAMVDDSQKSFDAAVTKGRRMTPAQQAKIRSGAVFGAREALQLGLIDGIQSFEVTLRQLAGGVADPRQASTGTKMEPTLTTAELIEAQTNAMRQAAAAEQTRIAEIQRKTAGHPQIAAQAISEGWTVDKAESTAMKAGLAYGISTVNHGGSMNFIMRRNHATNKEHLTAAFLVKAGRERFAEKKLGSEVMEQSRSLHRMSLIELCKASLVMDGKDVPSSREEIVRQAGASTGNLPLALSGSMDIALEQAYGEEPTTWRSFCDIRSTSNFREQTALRPSFYGDLELLGSGGIMPHGTFGEEATFTWEIDTYAKMLTITRQAFYNDDLDVFDRVIPSYSKSANRTLANLIYKALLANAGSFFGTDNGNYQSGGPSALSLTSLAVAVKQLRIQQDEEGNTLDLTPATLVVGPSLETTARALLNSLLLQRTGDNSPTGNPLQGIANLEIEPRLENSSFTGYSATAWYLFAKATHVPMVVGYLDGKQTPTTKVYPMDHIPGKLEMTFEIYHDFGTALGDPKAAQKSAGA